MSIENDRKKAKYIVTTICELKTNYFIEANSREEAEEKYHDQDWIEPFEEVSYDNEHIIEIKENEDHED